MNRRILIGSLCIVLGLSCKKSTSISTETTPGPNLTQINRVIKMDGGISFQEQITYQYDQQGRMIREGSKSYTRDEQGRIIQINVLPNLLNRTNIQVYYSGPSSKQVAYTTCQLDLVGKDLRDSTVYEHNRAGQLTTIRNFMSENRGAYFPEHIYEFEYDALGNIQRFKTTAINGGTPVVCADEWYIEYDGKVNPVFTIDEVRIMESYWGGINVSKNNLFERANGDKTLYEYYKDGRPKIATVYKSGVKEYELQFIY